MNGPASVTVGSEFSIEVAIVGGQKVFSAPLFVAFDTERLELVRTEEGEFLRQGGQNTVFVTSQVQGQGQLIVGYKQGVGGSGASGDGTLFRLTFRGKAAGTAKIGLERVNFRDTAGKKLNVTAASLAMEVK